MSRQQYEYFYAWYVYEDYIKELIDYLLKETFDENELKILWSQTDRFCEILDQYCDDISDDICECSMPDGYCLDDIVDLIFDDLISVSVNYTNSRIEKYLGM